MAEGLCIYCGDMFELSPRHNNQTCCVRAACQKAKKAEWQRRKMKTDPEYRASQKVSQGKWAQSTPRYWKEYRKNHPEKAERNRLLQAVRNRRAKARRIGAKMDASGLIAKMDASKPSNIKVAGRYWLVPVIAKMDALEANIVVISRCCV